MRNLLLRICNNIIEHPNNPKFKNLNYIKINKKFSKCKSCVDILICAGFYKSDNGERLLFNNHKLHKLKEMKELILSSITANAQNAAKPFGQNALNIRMHQNQDEKQIINKVCNYIILY